MKFSLFRLDIRSHPNSPSDLLAWLRQNRFDAVTTLSSARVKRMKDAAPCLEVEDISFSLSQLNQLQPYQLALAQFNFDYDPETMTKRILSLWNQKRETRRSAIQNGKANEVKPESSALLVGSLQLLTCRTLRLIISHTFKRN